MLPAPAHHVVIDVDYGGQVADYSARVSAYLKRKAHVRIEGEGASACTLVTKLPAERICMAPSAKLEFHQAYNPDRFNPLNTSYRNPVGTSMLMAAYPPAHRPAKKQALTADLVAKVVCRIKPDLVGLRDRALILLCFGAALRRSELVALDVNHLERHRRGLLVRL